MSGEVLRAMMVRVASRVSVVRSGGNSSSSAGSTEASVSQPSVVRIRRSLSKRLDSTQLLKAMDKSYTTALAYFDARDRQLLPAIKAGDKVMARKVCDEILEPLFTEHRGAIDEVIRLIGDDAADLGCLPQVEAAREILTRGTSADRQLSIYRYARCEGGARPQALGKVVDWLISATEHGAEPPPARLN